ncbi:nicotinate-nucleotide--dimethylbenzimidazole phosphoribosyltransferase [bacterium]|nr:nicotinate-nucleotide--dimethylbenzimidazole phosphoribosyltransferase [bacterium]
MTHDEIARHLDSLTKPPGSLGRLEELAARLCSIQASLAPRTRPRRLVVFAADHGVVAEGVSAWPQAVTGLMVRNILAGGAASSVLARSTDTELVLVDVGAASDPLPPQAGYVVSRVRPGTRNLAREPALTVAEFDQAWEVGAGMARGAGADGMRVVAAGEMGIGNTTAAACLATLLTGTPVDHVVGRGAGADDATLARKRAVVGAATRGRTPGKPAVVAVAGLEIAAMAGFYAAAAAAGLTVVLDGFIATAAALVAETLAPGVRDHLIAAHRSAEPGHEPLLRALGVTPLLDSWQMRLGEGTGALAVMPLLDAAAAVVREMATFDQAGIRAT